MRKDYLQLNSSTTLKIGPFISDVDGITPVTNLVATAADIRMALPTTYMEIINPADPVMVHVENGWYDLFVDAANVNVENVMLLMIHLAGALPVRQTYTVADLRPVIITQPLEDASASDEDSPVAFNVDFIGYNNEICNLQWQFSVGNSPYTWADIPNFIQKVVVGYIDGAFGVGGDLKEGYYRAVITNTDGLTTISNICHVSIEAP